MVKSRVWRRSSTRGREDKTDELNRLLKQELRDAEKSPPIESQPQRRRRIVRSVTQRGTENRKSQKAVSKSDDARPHGHNVCRWQKNEKYYLATLCQDMFGEWILHLEWGHVHRRNYRKKIEVFECEQEARSALSHVAERQIDMGYLPVDGIH